MSSYAMRSNKLHTPTTQDRPATAVKQGWRLPEPAPTSSPPGSAWKWLLAAAIVLQAAWIIALAAMAAR